MEMIKGSVDIGSNGVFSNGGFMICLCNYLNLPSLS